MVLPDADPAEVPVVIGGVRVSVLSAVYAASVLERAPGLMIRQPLARIGHPLAKCNYHAEAAPYRDHFLAALTFSGRGAAGRHVAKHAFIYAVRGRCREAMELAVVADLLDEAYAAMGSDPSYIMEMAETAVAVMVHQHQWQLRQQLKAAQVKARKACSAADGQFMCSVASACGTGDCRFAEGIFAQLTAEAKPGRSPRPANHGGDPYSAEPALAELEQLYPFRVAV